MWWGLVSLHKRPQGAPSSPPPRGDTARRWQLWTRKGPRRAPDRSRPSSWASGLRAASHECLLRLSPRPWPQDSIPRGPGHVLRFQVGMNPGGQTRSSRGVWGPLCPLNHVSPHSDKADPKGSGGHPLSYVWPEGTPLSSLRGRPSRLAPTSLRPARPVPEGPSHCHLPTPWALQSPAKALSMQPCPALTVHRRAPRPGHSERVPGPAASLSRELMGNAVSCPPAPGP